MGKKILIDTVVALTDGVTAIQITKADGTTALLTFDTANEKLIAKPDYIPTADSHIATKKYIDDLLSVKKSGTVAAGSFSGNPKKATITFAAPMSSDTYPINITGADPRIWTYESTTSAGFIINANANAALTGVVSWEIQSTSEGY